MQADDHDAHENQHAFGPGGGYVDDKHHGDHEDIASFIRLDVLGALLSLVFVAAANALFVQESGVWVVIPFLLTLTALLLIAGRQLQRGHALRALALISLGNWFVAVAVSSILPFLWPVMALTVLMPLVLASPHLTKQQIVPAILFTAVVAGAVATIGLINDDGGVIDDIDDDVEVVVVVGALAAQIGPIGLIAWQHNRRQRSYVDDLQKLNVELRASQLQVAQSRDRVVQAADAERRRIERDLHDGAQQRLVALGVRLRLLQSQGHEDPAVRDDIDVLTSELDAAIQDVRELAHGIYPPLLQTRGLSAAIAAVIRRSPLDIRFELDAIPRLDESVESALYYTALEALTNAAKHVPTAVVEVRLEDQGNALMLKVADDGAGFDTATAARSHGFDNMSDRLAVAGGAIDIASTPGQGTVVTATVPQARAQEVVSELPG